MEHLKLIEEAGDIEKIGEKPRRYRKLEKNEELSGSKKPELERSEINTKIKIYIKHEYKTIDHIPNDKELEDLGNGGWELCSILNIDIKIIYYFKRKCGELMTIREYGS